MNSFIISCISIVGLMTLTTFRADGQEEDGNSAFQKQVDSVVQNMFQRFDDKLGTYIFRDEPSEDTDHGTADFTEKENSFGDNPPLHRTVSTSSCYGVKPDHGVMRNTSPVFPWETVDEHVLFRYNRVEGLFLGLNYPQKYYWDEDKITLFASGGYGLKAHRWRGGIGGAQQFGTGESILELGVEGHSVTDTRDQWIIGLDENNLAALITRDDYRDYFGREGYSVWTGLFKRWVKSDAQFQIAIRNDRYESLERTTHWSVFGGDKFFRENPAIVEGRMKSILTTFKIHVTESQKIFTTGWSASASAEIAGNSLGGDYDFNAYTIDLRRYQPISRYNNLNIRLRGSSATGGVPPQKVFDLGGLGTLPAFRFKEFTGNRMLLANAEVVVNGKMFDDVEFFPSWLLRNLNVIFFADAGYIANAEKSASPFDGYQSLDSRTIRSDWGLGIGTRDAKLRLGVAWRTDEARPPMVFLRFNRPF